MTDRRELPATLTNLVAAHHRVRAGKGIRRVPGQMNRTEAAYAARLDVLKVAGEVAEWWYEGITLKLGADCRYTPDFLVMLPDLTLEVHETKGFMRDDALVKLRVAAGMFPFRVRLVRLVRGAWIVRDFSREAAVEAPGAQGATNEGGAATPHAGHSRSPVLAAPGAKLALRRKVAG